MESKVRTTTLEDICNKLIEYKLFDFSVPLQVRYRMQEPDLQDGLFGFCIVGKKMSGFTFMREEDAGAAYTDDGDDYSMSDEIMLWSFNGALLPTLTVYIPTEWLEG